MIRADDRAVSDVIAFVLVFSIIITSVGIVTVFGFGALEDLQEGEQDQNAERAMESISLAFGDIEKSEARARQSELRLSGRALAVQEGPEVTVDVDGGGNPGTPIDGTVGSLVYGVGDETNFGYEGGAVMRTDGDGADVMVREPRVRCDREMAVVSIVELRSDQGGLSGEGTVRIIAQKNETASESWTYRGDGDLEVDISVDGSGTNYDAAWDRYENELDCEDLDRVVVRHTVIDIQFRN